MRSIIFLFGGQGSQYYQMGAELYHHDRDYQRAFDDCAALAGITHGRTLIESVFGQPMVESESYDDLEETNLVLLAQGYAMAQALKARGIQPDALAGYSLGEFTAAVVSGAIALNDAIVLLRANSQHVKRHAPPASMLAVLASPQLWLDDPDLARWGEIGCINSPHHFVVIARPDVSDSLTQRLNQLEVHWARLPIRNGFHSSLLDAAERDYPSLIDGFRFSPPNCPTYSSYLAGRVHAYDGVHFWKTARGLVRFRDLIVNLWAAAPRVFVDCSPSGTLAAFIKQILGPSAPVYSTINRFGRNIETMEQIEKAYKEALSR